MWFGLLTLATALIISVSAAYYSILGLTAIFAAAFWPIVILGSSLEVGKVVSTLWLHKYWDRAELQYKLYLCTAVLILMVLTSMGVFGFLSKAHSDQSMISGDVIAKISIYDEKIKQARDNIAVARSALTQMDAAVDQTMSRSSDERGADKAAQLRRSQAAERTRLLREIETEQKKIQALNDERAPIAAEVRKVEAEVGPIKYIAALIYGDNADANMLERAVRWVIILIVIVFDPLALTLLLAATKTLEWERGVNILAPAVRRPEEPKDEPEDNAEEFFDRARNVAQDLDAGTYEPPEEEPVKKISVLDGLNNMWAWGRRKIIRDAEAEHAPLETPKTQADDPEDEDDIDPREKEAIRKWKLDNPDTTIKHWRKLHRAGKINMLPWREANYFEDVLGLKADNVPEGHTGEVKGFGIKFPEDVNKGDMFLRVDQLPSRLYKFNGANWIEVDKNLSDQHAYDDAYIDHLIDKIGSGEYDPDLLSNAERDRIEEKLQFKK